MRISVVTVTRNNVSTIADTIRSVASQTHRDREHIVIDGASTDGTLGVVEAHRDAIQTVVSEPDRGIYDAMNKGIRLATGEVVGTLNADDWYAGPRVLAEVARAFADPAVDACYGDLLYVDQEDTSRIVRYWRSREYVHGLCRTGWMPAHPTFFVRRRVYERYGLFDLQYRFCSDFELTTRFLEIHRIQSVYIPRIMVHMRTGGATNRSIGNIIKGNLESYRACRKHELPVTPLFVVRKVLQRVPQFFQRPR